MPPRRDQLWRLRLNSLPRFEGLQPPARSPKRSRAPAADEAGGLKACFVETVIDPKKVPISIRPSDRAGSGPLPAPFAQIRDDRHSCGSALLVERLRACLGSPPRQRAHHLKPVRFRQDRPPRFAQTDRRDKLAANQLPWMREAQRRPTVHWFRWGAFGPELFECRQEAPSIYARGEPNLDCQKAPSRRPAGSKMRDHNPTRNRFRQAGRRSK